MSELAAELSVEPPPTDLALIDPPIGHFLTNLLNTPHCSDAMMLEPSLPGKRVDFFDSDDADPALSDYANLMRDPAFRAYVTAGVYTAVLHDVLLVGVDGVVAYEGQILRDSIVHIMYWSPDSQVAEYSQAQSVRLRHPLQASRRIVGTDCMIGYTGSWRNYAHWMQECLPKLYVFKTLQQTNPGLRLLLPAMARDSYQQQTLDLLGIGPMDMITVGPDEILGLDRVRVVSNVDLWGVPPFARRAADFLAACIDGRGMVAMPRAPRVYIHRDRGARRVANFNELRPVLLRHGFMVAVFDDMPLAQQIATMRAARWVVGEHGAGLVNEIFCPPGSAVLEMFNPACVQPAFWSLASACGSRFGYLIGSHVGDDRPSWNTDYIVPAARLEAALIRMSDHG